MPLEEATYIRSHYKDLRILNDYTQGGYLIYGLGGTSKIFIDSRTITAYSPEVISEYISMITCSPGWFSIFEKYRINAVLAVKENSCMADYMADTGGWEKVFSGKLDDIYIQNGKAALIK